MKRIISVLALLVFLPQWAYCAAGHVLTAVGDVVAERGGSPVALHDGSAVESGDTLRVGERSSVQLRMADEAIIALRAKTVLRLDRYVYSESDSEKSAIMSLLAGGLRTVTGLVGKLNRSGYQVRTSTGYLGVRGTHFTLVQCSGNCSNADGTPAADGLFGGVTEGRVALKNNAGEQEFGKNQYFYVASLNSLPKLLPTPPSFLRNPLDARARNKATTAVASGDSKPADNSAKPSTPADPASTATADASAPTSTTTDTTLSGAPAAPVVAVVLTTTAPTQAVAPLVVYTSNELISYVTGSPLGITAGQQGQLVGTPPGFQTDNHGFISLIDWRMNAQDVQITSVYPAQSAGASTANDTEVDHYIKTASTSTGFSADAGNVSWGQYTRTVSGAITAGPDAGVTFNNMRYGHWADGDYVTQMPTTGSYVYSWVGGTVPNGGSQPTSWLGTTGALTSGGQIGVRFDNQTMSTLAPITFSMPTFGTSYSIGFQNSSWAPTLNNGVDPTTGVNIASLSYPIIDATPTSSCHGCVGLVSASVVPNFFGTTAQGLGLAVTTSAKVGTTTENASSVQIYKR